MRRLRQAISDRLWLSRRPRLLLEWYRLWGTFPVSSWIHAAHYFQEGDFRTALEYYERGLNEHPAHRAAQCARLDISYCRYRLDQLEEAIDDLTSLTAGGVPLKDAYLLLAKIYHLLGRPLAAVSTLSRALELFPSDSQVSCAYMHLALSTIPTADVVEELKELLIAIKRDTALEDLRQIHIDAALAHFEVRCGDAELGDRILARVLATGHAPFEAVVLRAERLLEQQRIIPAREQLARALAAMPRSSHPARLLAESYLVEGILYEPEWARQLATVACTTSHWQDSRCLDVLIRAVEACGDFATAELYRARHKALTSTREYDRLVSMTVPSALRSGSMRRPSLT